VTAWQIEATAGDVGAFHHRPLPEQPGRALWLLRPAAPAVVLGAAQADGAVDVALAAAHGVDVVRRRSGGSAVLVAPGQLVWADFVIGRDDPLWHEDIGRATWWVGECWRRALAGLGIEATVHCGAMQHGPYSDRICFAGLGPGELTVAGRKVVGLSQRRTRGAARFQSALLLRWEPALLAALCGIAPLGDALDPQLADVAAGVDCTAGDVEAALVAALPD